MKKTILSIMLVFVLLFSASGCAVSNPLTFTKNWNGGNDFATGSTETIKYSVNLRKDTVSGPNFSYSSDITNYSYDINGEYEIKVTATTITKAEINSDIFESSLEVYKITSNLNLTTIYNGVEYQDYANTECYVSRIGSSLTPIYSKAENKFALLHSYNGQYAVQEVKTVTNTIYNKNSYTLTKTVYEKEENDFTELSNTTNTYNEIYENYIDNAELLFALRNFTVEAESSKYLPTASYTYGSPVSLYLKNLGKNTETAFDLNYNGTNYQQATFPIDIISFSVGNEDASGMSQIIYLQNGIEENTTLNRALIVKYIEPLTTYTNFKCMGSLVYTLSSVSIV